MMERTTRKQVEGAFEMLCKLYKKAGPPYVNGVAVPGAWRLDKRLNGYVVEEIMEGGGIRCPLGHFERSAREFVAMVQLIRNALYEKDHSYVPWQ